MKEPVVYALVFGLWLGFFLGLLTAALLQPRTPREASHG